MAGMNGYAVAALSLYVLWLMGWIIFGSQLGRPNSPMSLDDFRTYSTLPISGPVALLVILWTIVQFGRGLQYLGNRLRGRKSPF